jgi:hypothetical protein
VAEVDLSKTTILTTIDQRNKTTTTIKGALGITILMMIDIQVALVITIIIMPEVEDREVTTILITDIKEVATNINTETIMVMLIQDQN